jgi:hypothetical protein
MSDDHLGGFVPGGDPNTYYPKLWAWLVEKLHVKTMCDVGAGDGVAVDFFDKLDVISIGIDGVWTGHKGIIVWDYTKGPFDPPAVDLIWSCEFVEHVEERYVANFLTTFARGEVVAMTHATPGQPGYHHVNCRDAAYWVAQLDSIGYDYDPFLTAEARTVAATDEAPHNYFVLSGLLFRRRKPTST